MDTYGLKYFLSVIALVFIIEGMPYFISPSGIKKWLSMVNSLPDRFIRVTGLVFMSIGVFILYIALRVV